MEGAPVLNRFEMLLGRQERTGPSSSNRKGEGFNLCWKAQRSQGGRRQNKIHQRRPKAVPRKGRLGRFHWRLWWFRRRGGGPEAILRDGQGGRHRTETEGKLIEKTTAV